MTGADWAEIIMASNSVFLQDYATITGKPIATQRPNSIMGAVTGTDLGTAGKTAGLSSSAVIVLIVLVVGAVFVLKD